jgi:hypothetical protein
MYTRSTSAVHLEKTASSIWRISVSCLPPIFCPVKKRIRVTFFGLIRHQSYDIYRPEWIETKYNLLVDFVVNWFQLVETNENG